MIGVNMAARFDWEKIRAEYEVGCTQSDIARRYGCSRTAIMKRVTKEGWIQDVTQAVNRLTAAKVAGVVTGCNPQKKAAAIDAAASRKAQVIERHKKEWEEHQKLITEAVADKDFNMAKLAKITSETISIRQAGERRAWGIIEVDIRPSSQSVSEQDVIRRGIEEAFASVGMGKVDVDSTVV